jgi:hypothetical protein
MTILEVILCFNGDKKKIDFNISVELKPIYKNLKRQLTKTFKKPWVS